MPYKNIVFVKLEKRLFNDHRWYMMSEKAQLNYVRFILLAAETYNKIPKNLDAIKRAFKTDQELTEIESTIKEIKANFPKFKENKHFYYFDGFDEKTNYIRERAKRGQSQVLPKVGVEEEEEEEKEKEGEIEEDVALLFVRCWNRNYKNNSEFNGAENLVKQFGYKKVKEAFTIAGEARKEDVRYVRGILNNNGSHGKEEKTITERMKEKGLL